MDRKTHCAHCGKELTTAQMQKGNRYCCLRCFADARNAARMRAVDEAGEFPAGYGGEANRKSVRVYLEAKHGHVCSICGRSEWDGVPIPLVVDHIDGNALNSSVDNFRLVCGNCNMLLDTFAKKNRYGRKWRREHANLSHGDAAPL